MVGEKNCFLEQHFSEWVPTMGNHNTMQGITNRVLFSRGPRPIEEKSMLMPLYTLVQFLGDSARWWVTGNSLCQLKNLMDIHSTCLLNICIVLAVWNLIVNKIETSSCPSDCNLNTFFVILGPFKKCKTLFIVWQSWHG